MTCRLIGDYSDREFDLEKLHTMCGIKTTFMITLGCVAFSMDKKFLSLEKFYTNIVTGVSDYYQVWGEVKRP